MRLVSFQIGVRKRPVGCGKRCPQRVVLSGLATQTPDADVPACAERTACKTLQQPAVDQPPAECKIMKACAKLEDAMLRRFEMEGPEKVVSTVADAVGAAKGPLRRDGAGQAANGSRATEVGARKPCFRLHLLPDHFVIDELAMVLPYNVDNCRFLKALEYGRLPLRHLESLAPLRELCALYITHGKLLIEVEDDRLVENAVERSVRGGSARQLLVSVESDHLYDQLEAMAAEASRSGKQWDPDFLIEVERAILPIVVDNQPCLQPNPMVGRIKNVLQYNTLKMNLPVTRTAPPRCMPLPVIKPRYTSACTKAQRQHQAKAGVLRGGKVGGRDRRHRVPTPASDAAGAMRELMVKSELPSPSEQAVGASPRASEQFAGKDATLATLGLAPLQAFYDSPTGKSGAHRSPSAGAEARGKGGTDSIKCDRVGSKRSSPSLSGGAQPPAKRERNEHPSLKGFEQSEGAEPRTERTFYAERGTAEPPQLCQRQALLMVQLCQRQALWTQRNLVAIKDSAEALNSANHTMRASGASPPPSASPHITDARHLPREVVRLETLLAIAERAAAAQRAAELERRLHSLHAARRGASTLVRSSLASALRSSRHSAASRPSAESPCAYGLVQGHLSARPTARLPWQHNHSALSPCSPLSPQALSEHHLSQQLQHQKVQQPRKGALSPAGRAPAAQSPTAQQKGGARGAQPKAPRPSKAKAAQTSKREMGGGGGGGSGSRALTGGVPSTYDAAGSQPQLSSPLPPSACRFKW